MNQEFTLNLIKHYNFAKKILILQIIRHRVKKSKINIKTIGFGAGSKFSKNKIKSLQTIAQKESSSLIKSLIICLISKIYKTNTLLELGTNLGFNAVFQALCHKKVISIEAEKSLIKFASFISKKLKIKNLQLINSTFENALPKILKEYKPDFIFLDGNHSPIPTLNYIYTIINLSPENTIILIDDIFWSKEMKNFWKNLPKNIFKQKRTLFTFGLLITKNLKNEK